MKQCDLYFLKLLQDSINILDEIDDKVSSITVRKSEVDLEISDLLHLVENEELDDENLLKVSKRIKELRQLRRSINNEEILIKRFQEIRNKLTGRESRKIISEEMKKTFSHLNEPYKNRILSDDEVKSYIGNVKTKNIGTKKESKKELIEKVYEMWKDGKNQKQIAITIGKSQGTVCTYLKSAKLMKRSEN